MFSKIPQRRRVLRITTGIKKLKGIAYRLGNDAAIGVVVATDVLNVRVSIGNCWVLFGVNAIMKYRKDSWGLFSLSLSKPRPFSEAQYV